MLRRLWLVLAQVVTATLGVIFVVSLVKPEWLSWRSNVVEIRETQQPATPFSTAQGRPVSFSDAARKAIASVVNISATKQVRRRGPAFDDPVLRRFFGERFNVPETQLSLGSGVIVSREGFILTNSHVVEGVSEIQVTLHDGRTVLGKIVGSDPETDLAVVRVSTPGLTPITFGQSEQLRVGDIVLAIGDPFSVGQTVTMGIVSALGREIGAANPFGSFIQTDAAINPGNSGGALVDTSGNLLGINTAIYSRSGGSMGIGFAIPVSTAKLVLEGIVKDGQVTRGWIGVEPNELSPELAETFGVKAQAGVIITGVMQSGPAAQAGIRPGDVINRVADKPVSNVSELLGAVAALKPGTAVKFSLSRKDEKLELSVTPGVRPKPRRPAP